MVSKEGRITLRHIAIFGISAILLVSADLAAVGCSSVPKRKKSPEDGWLKVDAGAFSVVAPPGWVFRKEQGIDSYVGILEGSGMVLHFDYGHYSSSLEEAIEPKYVVAYETIGGCKAKIVCPRTPGHGVTGIYFAEVPGFRGANVSRPLELRPYEKLCLWAQDLDDRQQKLALRVFQAIQFP